MPDERTTPAVFHPSVFLLEEIEARGWTLDEVAVRMGGDFGVNRLALDLYIAVGPTDPNLLLDGEDLARAFGVSADFFRNLETARRKCKMQMSDDS